MRVLIQICGLLTEQDQRHRLYIGEVYFVTVRSISKKMMLREDDPPANQAEFYVNIW